MKNKKLTGEQIGKISGGTDVESVKEAAAIAKDKLLKEKEAERTKRMEEAKQAAQVKAAQPTTVAEIIENAKENK